MKRLRLGAVIFLCVSIVLLNSGCNNIARSSERSTTQYSGEEIFRGLFFGEGAVAAFFPEIWEDSSVVEAMSTLTEEDKARFAEQHDRIIGLMKEADATFFDRFGEVMQSGNQPDIYAQLEEATTLLTAAFEQDGLDVEAAQITAQQEPMNMNTQVNYNYSVNINYSYAYTAAAVAAVVFLVLFLIDFTPLVDPSSSDSRLAREQLVDKVAKQLHYAAPTQ